MNNCLRNVTAARFNQLYTIGACFNYYPVMGIPDAIEVVTESEAWDLCGRPVVKVAGRIGGVSVSHLEPINRKDTQLFGIDMAIDIATENGTSATLINWDALPAAWRDALAERQRQTGAEGWTAEHDDGHTDNELPAAAICYINPFLADDYWPWSDAYWKPADIRRNMVKAAALILAEIERLDRLEANHGQ